MTLIFRVAPLTTVNAVQLLDLSSVKDRDPSLEKRNKVSESALALRLKTIPPHKEPIQVKGAFLEQMPIVVPP